MTCKAPIIPRNICGGTVGRSTKLGAVAGDTAMDKAGLYPLEVIDFCGDGLSACDF